MYTYKGQRPKLRLSPHPGIVPVSLPPWLTIDLLVREEPYELLVAKEVNSNRTDPIRQEDFVNVRSEHGGYGTLGSVMASFDITFDLQHRVTDKNAKAYRIEEGYPDPNDP